MTPASARASRSFIRFRSASLDQRLAADEDVRRKDLPDLCEWMLGTGVRIGEPWP